MRRAISIALAVTLMALVGPMASGTPPPPERPAPPGQVTIVTVNGEQAQVLDVRRFNMLFNLTRALRRRPLAFDGGRSGAAQTVDVVTMQEMTFSNIEILQKLLNQRHEADYQVAGSVESRSKFLYNANTVEPVGDPVVWIDSCLDGNEGRDLRKYQFVRFVELASGTPFTLASVHFNKAYKRSDCLLKNVEELRAQVEGETSSVFVAGDFNKRPVSMLRECDPEENSEPQAWWLAMTQPTDGGHAYVDTIRWTHETGSMADEWTHEWRYGVRNCDGVIRPRRSRIDYLFSYNAVIADAHTDHPGWAGFKPGEENENLSLNGKYSDHRFVWGRFVIAGPEQPEQPDTTLGTGGTVALTWQTVTATTQWRIYRAIGTSSYRRIATLPASSGQTQTYVDEDTAHAMTYRYAIAPLDEAGAQGSESDYSLATPDAEGPENVWMAPQPGAKEIEQRPRISAGFDELVELDSIDPSRIHLVRVDSGFVVPATITRNHQRNLVIQPRRKLKKGERYRVVITGVKDELGNVGPRTQWHFTTEPPPPPPKKKKKKNRNGD